jgi:hypothetical protein
MKNRWLKILLIVAVVAVVASAAALATSVESGLQKAKTGVIQEVTTKKPIPGAYVIVRWYHYDIDRWTFGHGGRGGIECVYRAVAQADAQGRYTVPTTEGKFPVHRVVSLQDDTRYYWDLAAYAPGYIWAWPQNMYQTGGKHPAAHGFGAAETLDPVELTPRPQGSDDISLQLYECPTADGDAVPFIDKQYREAYELACEEGGSVWPRQVADLREHAFGVMPPLPTSLSKQLDDIRKGYRFNDPPSKEKDAQICAILKQLNEAAR